MDTFQTNFPAQKWEEALPIGNGRMGAMIFGQPVRERLQLNEDSIWYGRPIDRMNPEAAGALPVVRRLILSGKIPEAEELMSRCFSGTPQSQRPYQSAGDMELFFPALSSVRDYRRQLNLSEGLVQVSFRAGDSVSGEEVLYEREYLSSFPAQVTAIHMKASRPGQISFHLLLTRGRFYDTSGKVSPDTVCLEGNLGKGGIDFCIAAKACAVGGSVYTQGEFLCVEGADEATVYLSIETSFYRKEAYRKTALRRLEAAAGGGYEKLRREHVEDYSKLYTRVSLKLKEEADSTWEAAISEDPLSQAEIYFQYGRYLLVSCSRPGSLPANLQGIWNDSMMPPWDSKYTININTEMNYWPAEICNLSECHLPLFDLLKRMQENGRHIAREMYGCRGFVAHHNTDIWADCAPQDIYIPASYWVMGAAWLCTHIRTHYQYTRDEAFLKEMYPVLEEAVLFFQDYLTRDKGEYITCPSVSPENTYILPDGTQGRVCAGASMDSQILRDLFTDYLALSSQLGRENESTARTLELLEGLPPCRTGKYGQLMEWREDYEEAEPGHRHISQLYALHPSHQITPDGTPELAAAAERTLERRLQHGGGHTGWSAAWIVNFYARLGKGDQAWENLRKLWSNSTFPNLMDNHPMGDGHVFQIDGNLGACAAIAEMLVQSTESRTLLLPALPSCWKNGEVSGLKLVGGAIITLQWKNGTLCTCRLEAPPANGGSEIRLVYRGKEKYISLKAGEQVTINWLSP